MKKMVALVVVFAFVAATVQPVSARRRRGGDDVNWGAVAGIAIIAGLLGYGIHAKSQVQKQDLDNERYSKDHDSAIVAARVLKPGEAVDTDTNRPGHRRLQKTGIASGVSRFRDTGDAYLDPTDYDFRSEEAELQQVAFNSQDVNFGLDELERASRVFDPFGATSRERLAVLHVLEEAWDPKQVVYSKKVLAEDWKHLLHLSRKIRDIHNAQKEREVLNNLITYLDEKVFGGAS